MYIQRKRDIKPHITSDTSFDKLVQSAEKWGAISHSTGLYGTRNQHTNVVSNAVIHPSPKDSPKNNQGHYQRFSHNTYQYIKVHLQKNTLQESGRRCDQSEMTSVMPPLRTVHPDFHCNALSLQTRHRVVLTPCLNVRFASLHFLLQTPPASHSLFPLGLTYFSCNHQHWPVPPFRISHV